MKRLTEKQSAGYDLIEMQGKYCEEHCRHQDHRTCRNCAIYKAIQKLAHYEDLEEQGLLITLPCKVGDIVWTLKFPEITKEDGSVWTVCDRKKQTVVPVKFTLFILNDIGVYYFLTKEEAEAKLKELENV